MMHAPIFKKAALALAAAGLMASVPAHADTLAMIRRNPESSEPAPSPIVPVITS